MKTVIIGGVAGGATAAARLRRLNEKAEILIFEKSGYISYANCGLPYYIGEVITDKDVLTLQTPESFRRRYNVDVMVKHEVTAINTDKKTVTVCALESGKCFEETYDKLIISTGAKPFLPDWNGFENERVFTIRNIEDTEKTDSFIKNSLPKSVVIIGGGYIGLEMSENLKNLGLDVTIIERSNQLLATFDNDMTAFIHTKLRTKEIKLILGCEVKELRESNKKIEIISENKSVGLYDMVIVAAGVVPDTKLAREAGLKLGIKNSIAVNERMQTSEPDIYAVGDAVEITHRINGTKALISLAGPANKQGRIAADNICGIDSTYKGSLGASVLHLFDMTAASVGIKEAAAKEAGFDCESVILSPLSHASYYPGAKVMTVKIIFERITQRILGAQIVGTDGVDKRIDVISAAIQGGLSGSDLCGLELSYAPPYSSAKDPVNTAGCIIENIANGIVKQFHYDDIYKLQKSTNVFLLDTRTPSEYARGHADGFVNIPVDALRERIREIPKNMPVYVMCQSGLRSYIACRILSGNGYDCYNFAGGYRFYEVIKNDIAASDEAYPCGMEK